MSYNIAKKLQLEKFSFMKTLMRKYAVCKKRVVLNTFRASEIIITLNF